MSKTILGVLSFLLGGVLSLTTILGSISAIKKATSSSLSSQVMMELVGSIIALILFGAMSFYFLKTAARLIKTYEMPKDKKD